MILVLCKHQPKLEAEYNNTTIAFAIQEQGLLGAHGILPFGDFLKAAKEALHGAAYWNVPTLLWFVPTDTAMKALCLTGCLWSVIAMFGHWQRAAMAICLVLWLSLCSVGQDFYSFQWDYLLCEVGFLAIFAEAVQVRIWLFRWLLFRLMFFSGMVKLLSGDITWRNLTALTYHYYTQPLPTPLAWYMQQLPEWCQKISVGLVFVIELVVPFLFFAPKRLRHIAAGLTIALQVLILLTGNYTFFNLLTIFLCMWLFIEPEEHRRACRPGVRHPAERAPGGRSAPPGRLDYRWPKPLSRLSGSRRGARLPNVGWAGIARGFSPQSQPASPPPRREPAGDGGSQGQADV